MIEQYEKKFILQNEREKILNSELTFFRVLENFIKI